MAGRPPSAGAMSATYSPAFGPASAPEVGAEAGSVSEHGPAADAAVVSVYDQVLQSTSTSPAERTAQQQQEISSLRARLFEYKGEVEKLSLTAGLLLSLKFELEGGIVDELDSISVDLLDAKLQLQDALKTSVEVVDYIA
jgi:hypothetical protein